MNDIILESLRTGVLFVIILFILHFGRQHKDIAYKGWGMMVMGFILLFIGSAFDITDNFESLNKYIIIGDTPAEAFIEKMVGSLGGFILLAIGLVRWIPNMASIAKLNSKLKYQNSDITANEVLHSILESSPYVLYIKDKDKKHIVVNKKFEEVTGISAEKAMGQNNNELFSPEVAAIFNTNDDAVLSGESVSEEEHLDTTGGKRIFLTEKFPIKSEDDSKVLGIFGMSIDITD
ncbi:PAS domain-containing protein [Candidatus Gracilibacteria bacterium]|nr:PAS domain-containing protein [Candidatus Gracilibacteria bacterium]